MVAAMNDESIAELRRKFIYVDGKLYRVVRFNKPCDPYIPYTCKNSTGYYSVRISPEIKVGLHVAIWAYHNGRWPTGQIDHKDRNKDNNSIENLREVTSSQNRQNVDKLTNNTSGHKNVSWHKASSNWRIHIMVEGQNHYFGYYKDKEVAVKRAEEELAKLHPFNYNLEKLADRQERNVLRGSGDER